MLKSLGRIEVQSERGVGTTVTMTRGAPRLAAALRDRGLHVVELDTTQLAKGGGGVRCTALTLDNPR